MKTFFRRHRALRIGLAFVVLILFALGGAWWTGLLDRSETVAWQPPRHLNLEVYLTSRNHLGPVGSTGHPNLRTVTEDSHSKFKFSTQDKGSLPYEIELEYLGREDGGDHYLVQYASPAGQLGQRHITTMITYQGRDLELFRDDHYVIGLRPGVDKATSQP